MLMLLLAALVAHPIDPRITHPWELTASINYQGKVYYHTETYRNLEQCQQEQRILVQATDGLDPIIQITPCNFVGLT